MSKSFLNPYFHGLFNNSESDYFNLTMTNIMDGFYKSSMDSAQEGKFKALVVSGLISGETTGAGDAASDARIVLAEGGNKYYEVKVRPYEATYGLMIPDPCDRSLNITQRKKAVAMHEWARSEFTVASQADFSLSPAQEIICYYEEGSIGNSDQKLLRFEQPTDRVVRLDCLENFNIDSSNVRNIFTGDTIRVGDYDINDAEPSNQTTDNSSIVQDEQIPDTILPVEMVAGVGQPPAYITSIIGERTVNLPGGGMGSKFHAGIDIGAPLGTPIYAIADGVVKSVGKSPSNYAGDKFDADGYPKTGFGYLMVVTHVLNNNAGNSQKFDLYLGHIQEATLRAGDSFKQGDQVATVGERGGSRGAHLHISFSENKNMDPIAYFGWYNRARWKTQALKDQWANENPGLTAINYGGGQVQSNATLEPYESSNYQDLAIEFYETGHRNFIEYEPFEPINASDADYGIYYYAGYLDAYDNSTNPLGAASPPTKGDNSYFKYFYERVTDTTDPWVWNGIEPDQQEDSDGDGYLDHGF